VGRILKNKKKNRKREYSIINGAISAMWDFYLAEKRIIQIHQPVIFPAEK
jgi:hypothetical protein